MSGVHLYGAPSFIYITSMRRLNLTSNMNIIPYIDSIIEEYLSDPTIPEGARLFEEEAKRYFGEEAVELQVGLSQIHESIWKDELRDLMLGICIPGSVAGSNSISSQTIWWWTEHGHSENIHQMMDYILEYIRKRHCFWRRLAIMLHFPRRTITNEKGQSVEIQDLFVRIPLNEQGIMTDGFRYARTTYTLAQWANFYRHSHTPSIQWDKPDEFTSVCTGTGPINDTIETLRQGYSAKDFIPLFLWELDKIIGIESEIGGPYRHLSNIGKSEVYLPTLGMPQRVRLPRRLNRETIRDFVKDYLTMNDIPFVFQNGGWCLSTSVLEWRIKLTDFYINWVNTRALQGELLDRPQRLLEEEHILNNKLVQQLDSSNIREGIDAFRRLPENKVSLIFKGVEYKVNIIDINDTNDSAAINLLNANFCETLLYTIIQILNYRYGKRTLSDTRQISWTDFVQRRERKRTNKTGVSNKKVALF